MITLHRNIRYTTRSATFRLYYLTDLHLGAAACDERALRRDIKRIEEDANAYWIGGGDYIDAVQHTGDPRYLPSSLAKWVRGSDAPISAQVGYAVKMLEPIAGKCLGLVSGNHEDTVKSRSGHDAYSAIVRGIARFAKVEAADLAIGSLGFVVLHWRRKSGKSSGSGWPMIVHVQHGSGGGRLPGGHALALGRVLGRYTCDLAMLGHRHVFNMQTQVYVSPSLKHRRPAKTVQRMAMFVPGYLGTGVVDAKGFPVSGYAERKGLPPVPIGTVQIEIKPSDKRIVAKVAVVGANAA